MHDLLDKDFPRNALASFNHYTSYFIAMELQDLVHKKGLKRIGKIFKKGSIRLSGKLECQRNGNSRLNFGFLKVNKVGF